MPKVHNKFHKNIPEGAVYIGRPSVWGNPFTHINFGTKAQFVVGSRDEAVKKYEEYLLAHPELVARAKEELKGKDLVCWCAPKACHGDILLRVANEDSDTKE